MSVWWCVPSARDGGGTLPAWKEKGYKTALWRSTGVERDVPADLVMTGDYPGYYQATNRLIKTVLDADKSCDWVVCGGDDTLPDARNPEDIAIECSTYFLVRTGRSTHGVMQPTGDPWLDGQGRIIERIAGSPWIGREFCERANLGNGPWWPEYTHCFGDEELQNVATRLGVFWQRPDLTHEHHNWARARGDQRDMPEFLREANSPQHWAKYKALYERRKAGGFPGSEVLR